MTARNAKSPDHLAMIGAFLYKCLTMYPVGVPILSMGRPLARHAAAMRKTPTISR